jgi:hypothetical protein
MYTEWTEQLRLLSLNPMHVIAANNQYDREYLWCVVLQSPPPTRPQTRYIHAFRAGTTLASEQSFSLQCANMSRQLTGRDEKLSCGAHITQRACIHYQAHGLRV